MAAAAEAVAAENAKAVSTFYTAVNEAIRTGDAAPLDALVAPDLNWCLTCPGQTPDRAGLKRYVTDLHRVSPEMRLVVDEVVGEFLESVVVRVHVSGYPIADAASPWGPVDTLRLVNGQIAERRNGPDGATLAEPLLGARLDALPPAVTGVVMARLIFAVDSGSEGMLSAGPTLLVVESGALWVRIAYGGRDPAIRRADRGRDRRCWRTWCDRRDRPAPRRRSDRAGRRAALTPSGR